MYFKNILNIPLLLLCLLIGYAEQASAAQLITNYNFEDDWSSTGSVSDLIGNSPAQRTAGTVTSMIAPAEGIKPDTCNAARLQGGKFQINNVPFDTAAGAVNSISMWMKWEGGDSQMLFGWDYFDLWFSRGYTGFNTWWSDVYGIPNAPLNRQWRHIVVEITNGNTLANKIYIDGVLQPMQQAYSRPNQDRSHVRSTMSLGGVNNSSGYRFRGLIDNVKFYKGALSAAEIQADILDANGCKTPPILTHSFNEEWDFNALINDDTGNQFHSLPKGTLQRETGKICTAADMRATGTGDYIQLPDSQMATLGDFTFSLWVKIDNERGGTLISGANTNQDNEITWYYNQATTSLNFYVKGQGSHMNTTSLVNGQWNHVVWRRNSDQNCYFINGQQKGCVTLTSDPLSFDTNGLLIGQEQDNLGGGFNASQAWDGSIDELLIFNRAISDQEIQTIYAAQNNGHTWDDQPVSCPALIARYQFDEADFTTPAGITDSSGENKSAFPQSNATASPLSNDNARNGDPGTCGFAHLSSGKVTAENLATSTREGDKTTVAFWMKRGASGAKMPIGWDRYDLYFSDPHFGFNTANSDVYGIPSSVVSDNRWHHIVAEFTNGDVTQNKLYIDGVSQTLTQRRSTPSTISDVVDSTLNIGGWGASGGYLFDGYIDELHVYRGPISQKRINYLVAETHACPARLDHFKITHDNHGIFCAAETIRVNAQDANGPLTLYNGTITLDTQTGLGRWQLINGQGTFNDANTGDGRATYTFVASDQGQAEFALSYTHGTDQLDIDVYEGAIRDDDSEGLLQFSASGFTITANPLSNPPPGSINTAMPSRTAGTSVSLYIAAYATSPTDGQCGIIESYHGNKSLQFWSHYLNPSSGTRTPTVNGQSIASQESSSNTQLVHFNQGQAAIQVKYKDVGSLSLRAKEGALRGSTAGIIHTPASLAISVDGSNPAATNASGGIYKAAGEDFIATVEVRDAEGTVTPNFGREIPSEKLQISHQLVSPSGGQTGTLQGTLNSPINGIASGTFQWSEVGVIALNAQIHDQNYLQTGQNTTGALPFVGRFSPHHFALENRQHGSLAPGCLAGNFTYSGQDFGYQTRPSVTIQANNQQGQRTHNYHDAFNQLTINSAVIATITADSSAVGSDSQPLPVNHRPDLSGRTLTGNHGRFLLTLGDDTFQYVRSNTAKVSAFTTAIDLVIDRVTDNDAISTTFTLNNRLQPLGHALFYGRLRAQNVFGSEIATLSMPLLKEVYDANNQDFVPHTLDTCTPIPSYAVQDHDVTDNLDSADVQHSTTTHASQYTVDLSQTAPFRRGTIALAFDVPEYLAYPWQSTTDSDPIGLATFGIHNNNTAAIIYRREVAF